MFARTSDVMKMDGFWAIPNVGPSCLLVSALAAPVAWFCNRTVAK